MRSFSTGQDEESEDFLSTKSFKSQDKTGWNDEARIKYGFLTTLPKLYETFYKDIM